MAGGVTADHIAKWDGSGWTPLGSGMNGEVLALAVYDGGTGSELYAGGGFTTAGGILSSHVAKWTCIGLIFSDDFETGDFARWSGS